jgi:aerobic carbon-monoxide dehydrogenase medium subunit
VAGARGERLVEAGDFFLGVLESDVQPGELATEARFPVLPPGAGTGFAEVSRRRGDYAVCGVAALVALNERREIEQARAAYLSVGPCPRVLDLTEAVAGAPADSRRLPAAATMARELIHPEGDIHATAEYRRHLAGVLTERALLEALAEARDRVPQGAARQPAGRTR